MNVPPPDDSFLDVWRRYPRAMALAAAIGIGAGLIIGVPLTFSGVAFFQGGDEPPIRVKNSSLDLELMTSKQKWQQKGSPREWKITGKPRSKDELDVEIVPANGVNCAIQSKTGTLLRVTYSTGTTVDLNSVKKHTQVLASADLVLSANSRVLSYKSAGYISEITLDGTSMCTFKSANELTELWIRDF